MADIDDYSEFIVADNEEETATPQIDTEEKQEIETEVEKPESEVAPLDEVAKEKTETQRVSQRINEAKQHGKDEYIASQGYEWNGKVITTESQYNEAIAEQKEQTRRAELEDKGIDVKMMDDAIENNPTVKQARALIDNDAKQKAQNKMYSDFGREFPNVKGEQISQETWDLVNNEGESLVNAYTRQENKELKAKQKVYTQNETNKIKAPIKGGIATHGSDEVASEDDFMAGFNSIR